MAFEGLTEKLNNILKNLKGKGRLSEADVKASMREVKLALLEADVNFKVVKSFVNNVTERAIGQDVMSSLTPGQMVIKIVNEELTNVMGGEVYELPMKRGNDIDVIMMCGLQGAGKTTTAAKLAGKFKQQGKRPLLVGCDVYRPAAIDQLRKNGEKQGVPVFDMGTDVKPVVIAEEAIKLAKENKNNVVILDTAGRLHVDEEMMNELVEIKEKLPIDHILLTVDSMTGQDAVNVAETFNEKLEVTGVILTKLDGDTRGGAALSIRSVTGKPIVYVGMGEKLSELEQFYPDRMASRILGMGDILTLIDKAQEDFDEQKARELEKKIKKSEFDFNDYLDQIKQVEKLGGLGGIMNLLPGMGMGKQKITDSDIENGASQMKKMEVIINSMTKKEREKPDILNPSRKRRIANGAGVDIMEVNRLVKQFENTKKMMKQMTGMMNGKGKRRGGFNGFRGPFGF